MVGVNFPAHPLYANVPLPHTLSSSHLFLLSDYVSSQATMYLPIHLPLPLKPWDYRPLLSLLSLL